MLLQMGHCGESTLAKRCRYLLSNTCPVWNWTIQLACAHPIPFINFINLPDGMLTSNFNILNCLGKPFHLSLHTSFSPVSCACLTAEMLCGSELTDRSLG